MSTSLLGLIAFLSVVGGSAAAESPAQRVLTAADARQAEQWQKDIDARLDQDDLDAALRLAEKLHQLRKDRQGPDHWQTWDATFQVDELHRLAVRPAGERRQLRQAVRLHADGDRRQDEGHSTAAEKLHREALEIRETALPAGHPLLAQSLNKLGYALKVLGRYAEADTLFRQALDIRQKALPPGHPDLAVSLNNLGWNADGQGRYAEAEPFYRQAVAVWQQALPADHANLVVGLGNLARTLFNERKYDEAEGVYRRVVEIRQKALPPDHPDLADALSSLARCVDGQARYAEAERGFRQALAVYHKTLPADAPRLAPLLNNLALCLTRQGRFAEADPLLRQALAINRKALPPDHPNLAHSLNNLAFNLGPWGHYAEAEGLLREALAIRRKVLPADDPLLAMSLGNLAFNQVRQGKYAEAEQLHRECIAIQKKALPPNHPDQANPLNNLALNLEYQGRHAEAETLFRQALAIRRKALPPGHPSLANSLINLGTNVYVQGRYPEAVELFRQAGEVFEVARRRAGASGAARAQFVASWFAPPNHDLAALLARLGRPAEAWQAGEDSLARGLLDDLAGEPTRKAVASLAEVQAALRPDAALVFWLDWRPQADPTGGEHWVCLVRSRGEPIWLPLPRSGTRQEWTEDDHKLARPLREALVRPGSPWQDLARQVYRQRLAPLEPHLKGVRQLIIVPAGELADVPVEVLSDAYRVHYIPSATVHVRLRARHRPLEPSLLALGDPAFSRRTLPEPPDHGLYVLQVRPDTNAARSGLKAGDVLLRYNGARLERFADLKVVADATAPVPVRVWRAGEVQERVVAAGPLGVSFARAPAAEVVRKQRQAESWLVQRSGNHEPLPGTRLEVEAVGRLFERKRLLVGSDASEQRLDQLIASGELSRYRVLHFATHGEMHPTRPSLCALVLARDHLPDPARQLVEGKKVYDGRLTVEALNGWPLENADLVVLSACETGLGPEGRGEGFLGFSQVLFRRGARSIVLSLWKVDDVATALLMQRFYQNLLGKRDGLKEPLGRADALAEAKSWLRGLKRQDAEGLAVHLSGGSWRGRVEKLPAAPEKPGRPPAARADDHPFAHPFYWAAFILLGDAD